MIVILGVFFTDENIQRYLKKILCLMLGFIIVRKVRFIVVRRFPFWDEDVSELREFSHVKHRTPVA